MSGQQKSSLFNFQEILWPVFFLFSFAVILFFALKPHLKVTPEEESQGLTKKEKDPYANWGRAPAIRATIKNNSSEQNKKIVSPSSFQKSLSSQDKNPTDDLVDQNPAPKSDTPERTYIVKEGDILGEIAYKVYGSTRHLKFLQEANQLDNPDQLQIGQVLRVPDLPQEVSSQTDPSQDFISYQVKKNESAWKIAQKFYGDGRYYTYLIEDNPEIFSKGITQLAEGATIKIRSVKKSTQHQ